VETLNLADEVPGGDAEGVQLLKNDRPGPVMVEVPADVALEEVSESRCCRIRR
jgi:glyoxylate carboligase